MTSNSRQNNEMKERIMDLPDFSNFSDIAASIKSFALEIENLPFANVEQQIEETEQIETISEPTSIRNNIPLELPCAPSANNNQSLCYFKTRSGGFKDYELDISEGAIIFRRPKSTKQQELSYELNTVQCLIRYTPFTQFNSEAA